jgi:aspartyl-tRNA synthetase
MLFKKRNTKCGILRQEDEGKKIVLNGWVASRRDLGGLIFIDLRDRWGLVQIVIEPENRPDLAEKAKDIRDEFVLWAEGTVRSRSNPNSKIPTGLIEVVVEDFDIINRSELPPFAVDDNIETGEETKLRYRYLDLRRPVMQNYFAIRNKAYQVCHRYFEKNDFIEVETPVLMKSTPEGARDFLVPSRISKGKFYALPQSPQIFKQILMLSGFERYMQIVKCFRDEDLRSDRQPEFTQIDVEMSFIDREDILKLIEGFIVELWKEVLDYDVAAPFLRMSYDEAMNRFGSDKPDLRFGMEISDITDAVRNSEFKVFNDTIGEGGIIAAINVKGGSEMSRKNIDELTEFAKKYGAKGLAWMKFANGEVNSPIAKFLDEAVISQLKNQLGAQDGDLILISSDKKRRAQTILGALRLECAKRLGIMDAVKDKFSFHWVIDFPLFEYDEDSERWVAMHHPFTSPMDEDIALLDTDPGSVRAKAYDLVVNGAELGGGSIRIFNSDLQQKMFNKLGLGDKEIEDKFGFFIKALKYGTPPHGGIALGLDRIVMTLAGTDNIRDVIAFPKTTSGLSLMDGSPSFVVEEQLKELGLKLLSEKQNPD